MRDIRERTFEFALRIIKLCQQLEEAGGIGRTLGWQLLRSGTSVGANVEEAQAGQSKLDKQERHRPEGSTRNDLLATPARRCENNSF